jgi:hypothetical protein
MRFALVVCVRTRGSRAGVAVPSRPSPSWTTPKIAIALRPCPSYVVFENAFVKCELFQSESPKLDPLP